MVTYRAFLVAWDKALTNVREIENDFKEKNIIHTVISSASKDVDNWVNLGADAWATKQIWAALDAAVSENIDYMFLVYGDAVADNGSMANTILSSVTRLGALPECSIYTTTVEKNHWGSEHTIIDEHDDGVFYICATDLTYVAFSRDTYTFLWEYLNYARNKYNLDWFKSSWGLDNLCWVYSICTGKNMFRDTNLKILHDISNTGYDNAAAFEELYVTLNEGYRYISNRQKIDINHIVNIKKKLDSQYHSRVFDKKDFYG
jgi:hypothetical protein